MKVKPMFKAVLMRLKQSFIPFFILALKHPAPDQERHFAFYALAANDKEAPKEIQLLPYGQVVTDKGRFLVDEQSLDMIMADFAKKANDIVVDYEHQTLKDVVAPAAAWIKKLINKGKDGLWGEVEWTEKARGFVESKEYKYLSPVIFSRRSDQRVISLHSTALTNTPAIDGMQPLANKNETEVFRLEFLKQMAALLGLPETATEEDVTKAINALVQTAKAQVTANKELLVALDLGESATPSEAKGKILALKNPTGFVRVEEFTALKDKLAAKERDDLVQLALKAGKITPAQKEWAEMMALKDPAAFQAFLTHAPVVVPVGPEVAGGEDPNAKKEMDDVQMSVNKLLGISKEDFEKFGPEAAAGR